MEQENDELRYRFTAWLTTLVRRAKINYLLKEKRYRNNNSIVNGKFDEDLKQYISLQIVKNISKFDINKKS